MNLNHIINSKYPQIFEYYFSKFLTERIRTDFEPNNYTHFTCPNSIQDWGIKYSEYFKAKEAEKTQYYNSDNLFAIDVFEWYTGYFYDKINRYLRGDTQYSNSEHIISRIKVLQEEIETLTLQENIVVLRRISNNTLNCLLKGGKLCPGIVFSDKAFLSTSLNLSARLDRESKYKSINNETLLIIKIPKGFKGIYLEPISKRDEYELLLQQDINMIVEEHKKILNNHIILTKVIS